MSWPVGRFPTIPEYYKEAINRSVDLIANPKQCCPFHKEDTPSFSYSREKMIWSCFGACHAIGKDVIEMHRRNYKLSTYEEAEASLRNLCKFPKIEKIRLVNKEYYISEEETEYKQYEQKAILLANCPDRWVELDYVMSKFPTTTRDLLELIYRWENE